MLYNSDVLNRAHVQVLCGDHSLETAGADSFRVFMLTPETGQRRAQNNKIPQICCVFDHISCLHTHTQTHTRYI